MEINASPESGNNNTDGIHVDEVTRKKIHEHLNNENDIITEQDIANINIGVGNENDSDNISLLALQEQESAGQTENEEDREEVENKKVTDTESPAVETPWNILGS
jgi:hypothetical protein